MTSRPAGSGRHIRMLPFSPNRLSYLSLPQRRPVNRKAIGLFQPHDLGDAETVTGNEPAIHDKRVPSDVRRLIGR